MSDEMNNSMSPETKPAGFASWLSTWMEAVTKPSEQTYIRIALSSNAKTTTALLWVFIGALINIFIVSLTQNVVMGRMMQDFGVEGFSGRGAGSTLIYAICGAPIGAIISVVFFAAFTGVVQWVAKMFGGTGTFEQLVYVFAAITVPFTLASSVLTLLGAIPYVGFCFGIIGALAGIYVIVLELMAIKSVNRFGWGQAAGSLFLPGIVLFCCIAAVVAGLVSLLIPVIRETVPQIY